MQKKKQIFFWNIALCVGLLCGIGAVAVAAPVAQAALVECGNEDGGSSDSGCQFSDLFSTAAKLINYLLSGAAVLAVGGVVYGGYLMVTSAGNSGRQGEGKKAVTNSMIGLAIILLAFLLVRTMFTVLGYKGGSPLENTQDFIDNGPDLLQSGGLPPDAIPPTSGGTPPGPTGEVLPPTGTAQDLARKLLQSPGAACFLDYHVANRTTNDGATARQNIIDTAAGRAATRSSYGTAPGGTVALDARMLQAILAIHNAGYSSLCPITALAGSSHSSGSAHYQGKAMDIDKTDNSQQILGICRQYGARSAVNESNHLHCEW